MTSTFAGKIVVVSGAAGGVGRSVVAKLLEDGARICTTDITAAVSELEQGADGTPGRGKGVISL